MLAPTAVVLLLLHLGLQLGLVLAREAPKTIDPDKLPVQEKDLFHPSKGAIAKALKEGLADYFDTVETEVVDSPDFTKKPFYLAAPGLTGSPRFVDVGGNPNLLPLVNLSKVYDFKYMNRWSKLNSAFVLGCGTGPYWLVDADPELIANLMVKNGKVILNLNVMSTVKEGSTTFEVKKLPYESRFALLATLFVSKGKPGKVIKVHVKKRIGKDNFIEAIRKSLKKKFPGKSIGLGSVFTVKGSKLRMHVTGTFSKTPLLDDKMVDKWLHYFEMSTPMTIVGSIFTNDVGMNVRVQNPHGFNDKGELGHYHADLSPDTVEYTAYLVPGEKVIRVDKTNTDPRYGND